MTRRGRLQPKFTITDAVAAGLTRIDRARGFLEAAKLSEDRVRSRGARALALGAHPTTHMRRCGLRWSSRRKSCRGSACRGRKVDRRSLQRDLKAMMGKGLIATEGTTHRLLYKLRPRG